MNTPEDHPVAIGSVLVLNTLQPVIEPLLRSIECWRSVLTAEQWQTYCKIEEETAPRVDRELAMSGRCLVFQGPLDAARSIEMCLRSEGLSTSLNVAMPTS